MRILKRTMLMALLCLGICTSVSAHELNPGYLQLQEVQPQMFEVMWKVPRRGAVPLEMRPALIR